MKKPIPVELLDYALEFDNMKFIHFFYNNINSRNVVNYL